MTFHETQLVAYAAGSVIHGGLIVLVLRLYARTSGQDRVEALERIAVCMAGFLWQFGNLWQQARLIYPTLGVVAWYTALISFPLLFSYSLNEPTESRVARFAIRVGRLLRYPLWIFTLAAVVSLFQQIFGKPWLINPDLAIQISLRVMLFYFSIFMTLGFIRKRRLRLAGDRPNRRANRVAIVATIATSILFIVIIFPGIVRQNGMWIELAGGMMTIPSTIATAYRLYRFPFMDAFVRETLTGIALLTTFCVGFSFGPQLDWMPLWLASLAIGLALTKAPLSRWVERRFLGYNESAEDQEERVGAAIRAVSQLSELDETASRIVGQEMNSDWARISMEPSPVAAAMFQIPDSPQSWLSFGPRTHGRPYMSRQLQLGKTAALQIAAQRQRLKREESERRSLVEQLELREITSRAQMKALQAQINPHFLFNTLNTLAALIESNPAKAEHVTENLADVFRYALDSTRLERVKLDDELKFLESYLAIEKARFESRLSYSFDVDPEARNRSIPPMILQPLVENAVRHGIGQKLDGGTVRVIARVKGKGLTLHVEDTGVGFVRERPGGVGLTNTRERLKHAYGETAEFRIEAVQPAGTRMVIELKQ